MFGNCFPSVLQSGVTNYPLQVCGLVNNRPQIMAFLLFYIFMDLSKLTLLLRPLSFHTANHEAIVFWCLASVAGYLLFDSLLYITLGNIYYCDEPTLRRALKLYQINISSAINISAGDIYVSGFHKSTFIFLTLTFVVITIVNSFFQCQRNRVDDIPPPPRPVLLELSNQRNQDQVQSGNVENGQVSEANIQNTRSTEASSRFENQGSINLPIHGNEDIQPTRPNGQKEGVRQVRFSDAKSKSGPSALNHQHTTYYRLDQSNPVANFQTGDGQIVKDDSTNPRNEVIMHPKSLLSEFPSFEENLSSHNEIEEKTNMPDNSERKYDRALKLLNINSAPSSEVRSTFAHRETIEPTCHVSVENSGHPQYDASPSQSSSRRLILCCSEISFSIIFFIFLFATSMIIRLASFARNGYLC